MSTAAENHAARQPRDLRQPCAASSTGAELDNPAAQTYARDLLLRAVLALAIATFVVGVGAGAQAGVRSTAGSHLPTASTGLRDAASAQCWTWDPAWSPDGSLIAFGSTGAPLDAAGSGGLIETVNPAGTELRVVTGAPSASSPDLAFHHDFQPAWSPDGRRLAFVRDWRYYNSGRTWDQWSLSVLDRTSGSVSPLRDGAADPTWSRTGVLAYDLFDGPDLDPAGLVADSRALPGSGPSWSPDGRRLASERGDGVFVVDRTGTRARRLARGTDPHWSPDGRWIAYRTLDETHIGLVSPDGKHSRRLARVWRTDATIVWSPDSTRLAIGAQIVTLATGKTRMLWAVHDAAYLGDFPGPSWSPDGRWLAYAYHSLGIIHSDGSGYHKVNPCALAS